MNPLEQLFYQLAEKLIQATPDILRENAKDLAKMSKDDPKYDRLLLTQERILSLARDIRQVATLPSPLGKILQEITRPNGLRIQKVSVPLGVIGIIYESRPNVTVDIFCLCFKAGNSCILKGGKEAEHSNQILANLI